MADGGGVNECDQNTNASCNDLKDSDTDDCHKQPTDDAELDEILEGTLHRLK